MQENANGLQMNLGKWRRSEQNAFLKALEKYGRNWEEIQKKVKTRSLTQIRSHANKIFQKIPKQDLDAYIGYENEFSDKKWQASKNVTRYSEKVRMSLRLQKKEKEKPLLQENSSSKLKIVSFSEEVKGMEKEIGKSSNVMLRDAKHEAEEKSESTERSIPFHESLKPFDSLDLIEQI